MAPHAAFPKDGENQLDSAVSRMAARMVWWLIVMAEPLVGPQQAGASSRSAITRQTWLVDPNIITQYNESLSPLLYSCGIRNNRIFSSDVSLCSVFFSLHIFFVGLASSSSILCQIMCARDPSILFRNVMSFISDIDLSILECSFIF